MPKYKVLVIDNILSNWKNPTVQNLYSQIIDIKYTSYRKVYGKYIAPFDTTDFFGTHVILLKKFNNEYVPLFTYKTVTSANCKKYGITFPGLALVKNDGTAPSIEAMKSLLDQCSRSHQDISYEAGWAIQNQFRKTHTSAGDAQKVRDLLFSIVVNHHREFKIPHMVACGVIKVKTDHVFKKMGMHPLCDNAIFKQSNVGNEEIQVLHTSKFSDYAYQQADEYKELWDEKVYIAEDSNYLPQEYTFINELKVAA
ncbi:MAG: hypothetical protein H6621_12260 [Halobacteriovoraceae bacterium]|nr:hypothetical protein [Halobacteriovoraceae bacterium]MCB9095833.1 hypothetical protein [Halobacteriovoraceae bacterium]